MKIMKKQIRIILSIISATTLILSLAGCNGNGPSGSKDDAQQSDIGAIGLRDPANFKYTFTSNEDMSEIGEITYEDDQLSIYDGKLKTNNTDIHEKFVKYTSNIGNEGSESFDKSFPIFAESIKEYLATYEVFSEKVNIYTSENYGTIEAIANDNYNSTFYAVVNDNGSFDYRYTFDIYFDNDIEAPEYTIEPQVNLLNNLFGLEIKSFDIETMMNKSKSYNVDTSQILVRLGLNKSIQVIGSNFNSIYENYQFTYKVN